MAENWRVGDWNIVRDKWKKLPEKENNFLKTKQVVNCTSMIISGSVQWFQSRWHKPQDVLLRINQCNIQCILNGVLADTISFSPRLMQPVKFRGVFFQRASFLATPGPSKLDLLNRNPEKIHADLFTRLMAAGSHSLQCSDPTTWVGRPPVHPLHHSNRSLL